GHVFLAGSALVEAAIGERIDNESLGGAKMHSEISGVTDYKMPSDEVCLETIRSIISKIGDKPKAGFDRIEPKAPKYDAEELLSILPVNTTKPYDTYDIISRIVDNSE